MTRALVLVLLLFLLLWGASAADAISHDASSNSGSGASVSALSWSHTNTAGDLIVVKFHGRDTTAGDLAITGITYNSVALTKVRHDARSGASWQIRSEIWQLTAPATGANTVAITFTGNVLNATASATTLVGVDQGMPVDVHGGANGSSVTPSATLTTTVDGAWLIDSVFHGSGGGLTVGSGQTSRENRVVSDAVNGDMSVGSSTEPKATAGSVTMDWTATLTDDWVLSAVALMPLGAGVSTRLPLTGVGR